MATVALPSIRMAMTGDGQTGGKPDRKLRGR